MLTHLNLGLNILSWEPVEEFLLSSDDSDAEEESEAIKEALRTPSPHKLWYRRILEVHRMTLRSTTIGYLDQMHMTLGILDLMDFPELEVLHV
jgi:hypothetical protein